MTNEQREAFFAAAIIYDGHEKLLNEKYIGRSNRYGFSQKNHDHGDALEICATLLGYRVSFRTKNANQTMRDWTISKRDYQSTQNVKIEKFKKEICIAYRRRKASGDLKTLDDLDPRNLFIDTTIDEKFTSKKLTNSLKIFLQNSPKKFTSKIYI